LWPWLAPFASALSQPIASNLRRGPGLALAIKTRPQLSSAFQSLPHCLIASFFTARGAPPPLARAAALARLAILARAAGAAPLPHFTSAVPGVVSFCWSIAADPS